MLPLPFSWVATEILLPLAKKRDSWYILAIAVLAVWLHSACKRVLADEAALAERPKVETQVKTVRVAGPVRVETKTVYKPGTTEVEYVDRVVDRAPVTTTTQAERSSSPACAPAAPAPWRYAGVIVDPTQTAKIVGARGGVTLGDRLDLGGTFRLAPRAEWGVEAGIRF